MEKNKVMYFDSIQHSILKAVENHTLSGPIDFEVSARMIEQYNDLIDEDDKEYVDQILEPYVKSMKVKNTSSAIRQSAESHKNLSLAWINLTGLSMCRGRLQPVCLEILHHSLVTADINKCHVHSLMYTLQCCMHMLSKQFTFNLRLSPMEVQVLHTAQVTCKRLMVHLILGHVTAKQLYNSMHSFINPFLFGPFPYIRHPTVHFLHSYILHFSLYVVFLVSKDIDNNKKNQKDTETSAIFPAIVSYSLQICLQAKVNKISESTLEEALKVVRNGIDKQKWVVSSLALDLMKEACSKHMVLLRFVQSLVTPSDNCTGLEGWPKELCMAYIDFLHDVVKTSKEPDIKRMALMGSHKSLEDVKYCKKTESLADLLFYQKKKAEIFSSNLRHCTYVKLSSLCDDDEDICEADDLVRVMCWGLLQLSKVMERDHRVLEAVNFIQMMKNSSKEMEGELSVLNTSNPKESLDAKILNFFSFLHTEPGFQEKTSESKKSNFVEISDTTMEKQKASLHSQKNFFLKPNNVNFVLLSTKSSDTPSVKVCAAAQVFANKADKKLLQLIAQNEMRKKADSSTEQKQPNKHFNNDIK